MNRAFLNILFLIGLAIRLLLMMTITPSSVEDWYAPFLNSNLKHFSFDPWQNWISRGGLPEAFPYGYTMWALFLPLTGLFKLLGLPVSLGYSTTLFIADFGFFYFLRRVFTKNYNLVLSMYWLSPIVILATYYLGFNDLIPISLLTFSLFYLKRFHFFRSGVLLVAAISAKLSMILAAPFFIIYFAHNRSVQKHIPAFLKGIIVSSLLFILPFALSRTGVAMLFTNPEMDKVYRLAVHFDTITVYIVPLVYALMLYAVWRVKRLNFDLFNAGLGITFLIVVLLTAASPGWFIWTIPLLVTYQTSNDRHATLLSWVFSVFYAASSLLVDIPADRINSLIHTGMITAGFILASRIWRQSVSRNEYLRLSLKPLSLGVAGNSSSGKDTYAKAITGLFGEHSVTNIYGDDYHLWDRQKPMWQVLTHLNPMANDIERFAEDLVSLVDGKSIQSGSYDHTTGRIGHARTIESNDVIIANGLHALHLPILRNSYSLSVFLDMDEALRRYFKIRRDVHERGHTLEAAQANFEKRKNDVLRFIDPQAKYADLILSLQPVQSQALDDLSDPENIHFKLAVTSRQGLNLSLLRVLVSVCGLHVDITSKDNAAEMEMTIEGDVTGEDIALAAKMICPRMIEFLDTTPDWKDGTLGVMQLITLVHINQALTKRII